MSKWKTVELGQCAEVRMGQSPDSSAYNDENIGQPFLQGCAEFGPKYPAYRICTTQITRIAPANSILISVRAPVGTLNIADRDYCIGRGLGSIKGIEGKSETWFLYYYIDQNVRQLSKLAQGSTFEAINSSDLKTLPVSLPPLPQQQKIAKILQRVDGQIEKTERIIAKYKAIKQGLMHDLFTRGINVTTGQLRPTHHQAPHLYKDSPMGLIPKEWEVVRISSIADITTGGKDTQNRVENGEYPFFVRSQVIEKINSYSFDGEAILTAGDGVGVGKVYHHYIGKFDFHQRVYMLFNFDKEVNPKFVYEYFRTHFSDEVAKYSAKTTVDSVRMEMIAGMLFIKPELTEQNTASAILKTNEQLIFKEEKNLQKLQQVKSGLMHDLLSGKVCVMAADEVTCSC